MLSMLHLSSMLFLKSGIVTGNETGSPSDVLGDSLALCGTIIYSLSFYPRGTPNKDFSRSLLRTL